MMKQELATPQISWTRAAPAQTSIRRHSHSGKISRLSTALIREGYLAIRKIGFVVEQHKCRANTLPCAIARSVLAELFEKATRTGLLKRMAIRIIVLSPG